MSWEIVKKLKDQFSGKKINIDISNKKRVAIFGLVGFLAVFLIYLHTPPFNFPIGKVFTISSGQSLQSITENLYEAGLIRSRQMFRIAVILLGGEKKLIAGDYLMDKREGPVDLAYRVVKGKFHLDVKRVTILEGWNVFEIADYLEKSLLGFDKDKFIALSRAKEGYLFPDTYFVSPTIKAEDVIEKMAKNFNDKVPNISGISTTTYKFKDVIIMASILEREARTMESRRIIAGILWKRLKINMPLQVDAAFEYVNGETTFELSLADLKIDSPYNTYKYKGLPPGPIGNPGADSIWASIHPTETKYLFYLTGKDGKMYYAKTFEEHVNNKRNHLW